MITIIQRQITLIAACEITKESGYTSPFGIYITMWTQFTS